MSKKLILNDIIPLYFEEDTSYSKKIRTVDALFDLPFVDDDTNKPTQQFLKCISFRQASHNSLTIRARYVLYDKFIESLPSITLEKIFTNDNKLNKKLKNLSDTVLAIYNREKNKYPDTIINYMNKLLKNKDYLVFSRWLLFLCCFCVDEDSEPYNYLKLIGEKMPNSKHTETNINIDSYSFMDIIAQVTEKSDNKYITEYTSKSIKTLFATNINGNIREMNRQQLINSKIDPMLYEILLAQVISRNDKDYFNSFQILNDVVDSWRIFINSENQVVGFWVFISLKDNAFSKYSSGQYDEKDINLQDIRLMSMQGIYKGYLLLSGIISDLRSPKISNEIYNSWIKWIEELADIGIFFSDICSIVSSTAGMQSLEEIGMIPYADYKLGGKCFKYNLSNISNIEFLCNNYTNLVEKYKSVR